MAESKKGNSKRPRQHKTSGGEGVSSRKVPLTPVQKVLLGGGALHSLAHARAKEPHSKAK